VGLLPGRVLLGDDVEEMNRTLPRGPGVPVKERAGPRRQPRRGKGRSGARVSCPTGPQVVGPGERSRLSGGESTGRALGQGGGKAGRERKNQGVSWGFLFFSIFFFYFLKPFSKLSFEYN